MKLETHFQIAKWPLLAWSSAALIGMVAPAFAMVLFWDSSSGMPFAPIGAPVLAVGLMGTGMIAAAAAGRQLVGVHLALLVGAGLIVLALMLGAGPLQHLFRLVVAAVIASASFAARGTLFACSAGNKGWLIAVSVVAGEAAVLAAASVQPGALPDWLLVLLPAQWANLAIQAALTGASSPAATAALFALGGTAAATLLVAWLWPRRWPYLVMFTAWLSFSALVWYHSGLPEQNAEAESDAAQSVFGM